MDVTEDLLDGVIDATRAMVAIATASIAASPVEVTLPQFRALVVLSGRSPATMSDVGRATGLSPSSTTRLVERLERKGLVARRPSEVSRRSIEVRLTEEGTAVVDVVLATRRDRVREVLAAIPADRRELVRAAFVDFARAAGSVPGTPYIEGARAGA